MSSHRRQRARLGRVFEIRSVAVVVLFAALGAGCEQHAPPRTFEDFMEDAIARDGALARCNRDRVAASQDVECANARRAAEAAAVAAERARKEELERQSERTLIALRDRQAQADEAAQRAAAAARAAEEAAYDAQWVDSSAPPPPAPAPEGIVSFDVYAQRDGRLRSFDLTEDLPTAPPSSEFAIAGPQLSFEAPAIPRPFRTADENVAAAQP